MKMFIYQPEDLKYLSFSTASILQFSKEKKPIYQKNTALTELLISLGARLDLGDSLYMMALHSAAPCCALFHKVLTVICLTF